MNHDDFLGQMAQLPFFDLPLAEQVMGKPRPQVVMQLSRWADKKYLLSLRRGLYTVSETFRKKPLSVLQVANELYRPSYLSGLWAMGFYGMIPEKVVLFTSISTRVTRVFSNDLGEFAYSSLRQDLFRNFSKQSIDGIPVWIADPEKALLDHWYFHVGEWNMKRMEGMRFQNFEMVDSLKLKQFSVGYPKRIQKAIAVWEKLIQETGEQD